jgi:DNA-binding transcriptional regulator YdaS (Cro superfamily)
MPSIQSILSALSLLAPLAAAQVGGVCEPLISQNNPISTKFTTQLTGTINSTIVVVPVNLTQARAIIPSQYPILTKQYQQWIPNLAADQYPVRIVVG